LGYFIVVCYKIQILKFKNAEITQKNEEIEIQKQNIEELYLKTSEAHESIKKSIDYAGIIQAAMINKSPRLDKYFSESFIIYEPKDIVGGDFYWYSKVDDKIIVAAVDCTGHGVPGAFLTVLGNNVLNQIVNVNKVTNPGEILFELDKSVKESLHQDDNKNKDGMDIALCTIDYKHEKIEFAGANNPMLLIHNNEINVIEGEKIGIAGFSSFFFERRKKDNLRNQMYNTKSIKLEKGMQIYLFSDGFQDQNGGEHMKKIRSKYFYELLLNNNKQSFDNQKKLLK